MSFDFEPPITHGELWCLHCLCTTWFVSWDEKHVGREHAECRECGFKYGEVEERVVDAQGVTTYRMRPVLEADVFAAAKAKMQKDFLRELGMLDVEHGQAPGYGAAKLRVGGGHGSNTAGR